MKMKSVFLFGESFDLSFTVSIPRSLCMYLLLTYHGAFTMARGTLLKVCKILMLLCLVHTRNPCNCIPYNRTCLSTWLKIRVVLYNERLKFIPRTHLSCFKISSVLLLNAFWVWRITSCPRYFALFSADLSYNLFLLVSDLSFFSYCLNSLWFYLSSSNLISVVWDDSPVETVSEPIRTRRGRSVSLSTWWNVFKSNW